MKTTIPIPVSVITKIEDYVTTEYPTITSKQKSRLFSTLIELWFFIKSEHEAYTIKLNEYNPDKLKEFFVNIPRTDFQKFFVAVAKIRFQYKRLLDILIELNLIDVNDSYSVGAFSKSYRPSITISYETVKLLELNVSKIFKNVHSKAKLIRDNDNQYRKLIDDMYLTKIDLESLYYNIDQMVGMKYSKNTSAVLTPAKIYALKIRALKINLGIHFFTVSETGRVYSSIANLPSLFFPYIRLNGKPVVEIDAVNSQPLLLSMFVESPEYKRDCEAGLFYDNMAKSLEMTRGEFKSKSYRWIFFTDDNVGPVWKERLDKLYPGLADQINKLKSETKLWFLLQQKEAEIWIKIAQKQIKPVLTKHDSIITTKEEVERIVKQIKTEYKKQNIKVKLEVETNK